MSDAKLRSDVTRIASRLPKGDETRRKLLSALTDARGVSASGPQLPPEYDDIIRDAVEDAIEDVGSDYESYNTRVIEP